MKQSERSNSNSNLTLGQCSISANEQTLMHLFVVNNQNQNPRTGKRVSTTEQPWSSKTKVDKTWRIGKPLTSF